MNLIIKSESDISKYVPKIIESFGNKSIILFYGEMGVGKTTIIKALCKKLGVQESTTSPTFSIVNEYQSTRGETLFHFDFYRVNKEEEVMDLGYEDYFYDGDYCFIEWPEKIPNLLPENAVKVTIEVDEDNNRLISVAS